MNKYPNTPSMVLDLHGHTRDEAREALDELVESGAHSHVRIITGRGLHSPNGPVLRDFVTQYLSDKNIRYSRSKLQDGGDGAIEAFLK